MTRQSILKTFIKCCARRISAISKSGQLILSSYLIQDQDLMQIPTLLQRQFFKELSKRFQSQSISTLFLSLECLNTNTASLKVAGLCSRVLLPTTLREWMNGQFTWIWRLSMEVLTMHNKLATYLKDALYLTKLRKNQRK